MFARDASRYALCPGLPLLPLCRLVQCTAGLWTFLLRQLKQFRLCCCGIALLKNTHDCGTCYVEQRDTPFARLTSHTFHRRSADKFLARRTSTRLGRMDGIVEGRRDALPSRLFVHIPSAGRPRDESHLSRNRGDENSISPGGDVGSRATSFPFRALPSLRNTAMESFRNESARSIPLDLLGPRKFDRCFTNSMGSEAEYYLLALE